MPVPPHRGPQTVFLPTRQQPGTAGPGRVRHRSSRLRIAAFLLAFFPITALAGDWPQVLGPHRNGVAVDETPPDHLPAVPEVVWSAAAGQGYSGPVVVGSRVILFHRQGAVERVQAFDRDSGNTLWQQDFAAHYRGGIDPDTGPRCVPVVANDVIVVYGAGGDVHARATGGRSPVVEQGCDGRFRRQ